MANKVKPRICRTNEISIPIDTEECVLWLNPVQSIDDIKNPTRDYAWITPDNTVYVFNGHKIVPIFSTNDSHIKWGHVDGDIKDQKDLYEILLKTVNGVKQNGVELPKDLEQKVNVSVPIMHIKVNNTEVEPNNYTVNIDLTTYAKTSDIPTKLSQLANDTGYITPETEDVPIKTITLNGALLNPDEHKNVSINIRTLKSVSTTYKASESDTNIPTGTWSTTIPKLDAKYPHLWTKTVYTYSDGSTETSYTVATTHSGIQLGGRNLLKGTSEKEQSFTYESDGNDVISYSNLSVPNESIFTLSFDAKSTVDKDTIQCFLYMPNNGERSESSTGYISNAHDGLCNVTLTTEWRRYWVRFVRSSIANSYSLIVCRLLDSLVSGTVSIRKIKFEVGNTATDWTPAPEDLEAYTDSKATEINNTLSTYAKKTDVPTKTSQLTNDSGYITSAQRIYKGTTENGYEGTGWVDGDLYVRYMDDSGGDIQ